MDLAGGISSERRSLEEVHGSIADPVGSWVGPAAAAFLRLSGPGLPGQRRLHGPWELGDRSPGWRRFGYALIWVLLMSNMMAILLQTLAARLGVVTGHDLAQACRAEYSRAVERRFVGAGGGGDRGDATWPKSWER